jgi:SMODS-associating 2TM, beta-strand rich effector domain
MDGVRKEVFLWCCIGLMLLLWVLVLVATGTPLKINWDAVKKLPDAITLFVLLSIAFTRWMWRWPIFTFKKWLVRIPDLQGTWDGQFQSTWENPETGKVIEPRRMVLVIRQTFRSISCTMFTAESVSRSRAAQVAVDEETGEVTLSYNYTNRSKATLRNRSPIHDGAAHLEVVSAPKRMLEGEYWTGRCTTGQITLSFLKRDLDERFSERA